LFDDDDDDDDDDDSDFFECRLTINDVIAELLAAAVRVEVARHAAMPLSPFLLRLTRRRRFFFFSFFSLLSIVSSIVSLFCCFGSDSESICFPFDVVALSEPMFYKHTKECNTFNK
jgi:hypothetical protein